MPWRAPGTSIPLDSCGIASGFLPDAAVQYPHQFSKESNVKQGDKGTALPFLASTTWTQGSTVKAAFTLVVNHGGGYQYRVSLLYIHYHLYSSSFFFSFVPHISCLFYLYLSIFHSFLLSFFFSFFLYYKMCPTTIDGQANELNEACFEKNPLKFADAMHTIRFADTTNPEIQIPAVDVTKGVVPEGFAWRRLPLPACNCDLGAGCTVDSTSNDYKAYVKTDSSAFGHCTNGLQFEAAHLTEGTWKTGYGYYVEDLNKDTSKNSKNSKTTDKCTVHDKESTCVAMDGCAWYDEGKKICYENTGTKGSDSKSSGGKASDTCSAAKDATACGAKTEGCTWYEQGTKKVCYKAGKKRSLDGLTGDTYGVGSQDVKIANWEIVDLLIAPEVVGNYVLQWRWDNEQTPQIWTTCSHVEVVASKGVSRVVNWVVGMVIFLVVSGVY